MTRSNALEDRSDLWPRATLLAVAATLLARALQISDGVLFPGRVPWAIYWLIPALLICLVATLAPLPRLSQTVGRNLFVVILAVCVTFNFAQLGSRQPALFLRMAGFADYTPFFIAMLVTAVAAGIVLAGSGWLRHVALWLMLAAYAAAGVWVIRTSPAPLVDVFVFGRDATYALANGTNPYSITFVDIYGGGSPWYGPGISVNGRLQFGYPYMPLSVLLSLPAHWSAEEFRYAHLAAMIIAAVFVAYAHCDLLGFAGAILLVSMPRSFYVLEGGWTEPFVVMMLAATMFCAIRLPRAMPFVLGLLLASKQYMPAAAALAPLLVPAGAASRAPVWRAVLIMLAKALIVAAVVSLPFFLADPKGFWWSVVALQMKQPYRWDSLSFLAWYGGGDRNWIGPAWLAFVALAIMLGMGLWRCPRRPAGFAVAVAACYFVFFAFNKQVFGNYYYFVVGAICCALAGGLSADRVAAAVERRRM